MVSMEQAKLSIDYSRVDFRPLIFMNPIGLVGVRPWGIVSCSGITASFVKWTNRLSSKYTLTSRRCTMNGIEDTRNLVKSNAAGIGAGSRRSISNAVHGSLVWLGISPRRTNNLGDVSIIITLRHELQSYAYLISVVLPVKPQPPPSRHDKGLLSDGEQAIEPDTERANLLLVRISISWIKTSAMQQHRWAVAYQSSSIDSNPHPGMGSRRS